MNRRWILLVAAIALLGSGPLSRQAAAAPVEVDDARLAAAGIRKIAGRHLVLYTDLPGDAEVDALPAVFDAAVPQWAAYFGVEPADTRDWHVRAFLIGDRARFEALGLIPPESQFVHGMALGSDLWLNEQPTAYYRRHLLLHEGTHAFMAKFLGGGGPGWYMEGVAELLGTHHWDASNRALQLNIMPRDRREVPMLGRVKLVRDAVAAGKPLSFDAVMEIDNRRQLGNDAYAWSWAAAKFLDSHPRYRERFRAIKRHVTDANFNDLVRREFGDDWNELAAEWQACVATLDYGYDFERMAMEFERGTPLSRERKLNIAADRGWQSSGVWLEQGKPYRVTASGRYQIGAEQTPEGVRPWPCEPGGITLEYHDGRPLGMLLGAIVPEDGRGATFAKPQAIGLGATVTPDVSGTLYVRVNDSPARLGDNRGDLTIEIAE